MQILTCKSQVQPVFAQVMLSQADFACYLLLLLLATTNAVLHFLAQKHGTEVTLQAAVDLPRQWLSHHRMQRRAVQWRCCSACGCFSTLSFSHGWAAVPVLMQSHAAQRQEF